MRGWSLLAAALVLTPGTPLGLLTNAVQTLAGVLLPSATVFLLLLCNDGRCSARGSMDAGSTCSPAAIIGVLVLLSVILTASVLYPQLSAHAMRIVLEGGSSGADRGRRTVSVTHRSAGAHRSNRTGRLAHAAAAHARARPDNPGERSWGWSLCAAIC